MHLNRPRQIPPLQREIFDVSEWRMDPEYHVFPQGSRPKTAIICPDPAPSPLLRAGHRYLFKESEPRYPAQYWAEVFAYRIGLSVGVIVPPAFAAVDSRKATVGTLIEWFYGYPGARYRRVFVPAVEIFKRLIPEFDLKSGRQHNLRTAITYLRFFQRGAAKLPAPEGFWGRALAFDSLIGNTDRHQENWGLLWIVRSDGPTAGYAPMFDNGSSLGHELTEDAIERYADPTVLDHYIARGRHHVRWGLNSEREAQFPLLDRFYRTQPAARAPIRRVGRTDAGLIIAEIDAVATLGRGTELTDARSRFISRIVQRRHAMIQTICEGSLP